MGRIISCECVCGYEKRLFCGVGMNAENTAVIKKCIPENVWTEFIARLENGSVSEFLIENKPAFCKKCREIFTVSVFTYKLSEGESIVYIAPCPECGGTARILDDIENMVCPECGRKITAKPTGRWD